MEPPPPARASAPARLPAHPRAASGCRARRCGAQRTAPAARRGATCQSSVTHSAVTHSVVSCSAVRKRPPGCAGRRMERPAGHGDQASKAAPATPAADQAAAPPDRTECRGPGSHHVWSSRLLLHRLCGGCVRPGNDPDDRLRRDVDHRRPPVCPRRPGGGVLERGAVASGPGDRRRPEVASGPDGAAHPESALCPGFVRRRGTLTPTDAQPRRPRNGSTEASSDGIRLVVICCARRRPVIGPGSTPHLPCRPRHRRGFPAACPPGAGREGDRPDRQVFALDAKAWRRFGSAGEGAATRGWPGEDTSPTNTAGMPCTHSPLPGAG